MQSIQKAANLLEVSEYHLLREAWLMQYGDPATDQDISLLFTEFVMFGAVPEWADDYARRLIDDHEAARAVPLNSFSMLNLPLRLGNRPDLSFSLEFYSAQGDSDWDEQLFAEDPLAP